jgi:hypothetical protein
MQPIVAIVALQGEGEGPTAGRSIVGSTDFQHGACRANLPPHTGSPVSPVLRCTVLCSLAGYILLLYIYMYL